MTNVAFSPDKRWLVVPGSLRCLGAGPDKDRPDQRAASVLRGHRELHRAHVLQSRRAVVRHGKRGQSRASLERPRPLFRTDRHERPRGGDPSLAFSGDSLRLATASNDMTVRLWNVASPFGQPTWLTHPRKPDQIAAVGSAHRATARGFTDPRQRPRRRRRPRVQSGRQVAGYRAPIQRTSCICCISRHRRRRNISCRTPDSRSPIFSPDGRWLATGVMDGPRDHLWDLALPEPDKEPVVLPRPSATRSGSLAFSADGRRLVSGANDGRRWFGI